MTQVRAPEHFQGFDGVLQGGIVAGLMDDAMWYAILSTTGAITMTAELTIRYKAPVPVETDLTVTGRLVAQHRILYTCSAFIADTAGQVLAEATAKFMPAPKSLLESLQSGLS